MAYHQENFVAIRTMHAQTVWRSRERYAVEDPEGAVELDYRDLLSAANEASFHREYSVALKLYLELREKILVQSHPELPKTPGIWDDLVLDASVVDLSRIVELSRRVLVKVNPGDPITVPAGDASLFSLAEVKPNEALSKYTALGVDSTFATTRRTSLRDEARQLVLQGEVAQAGRLYAQQAKVSLGAGDVHLAADTLAEAGAVMATYQADATGGGKAQAARAFTQAADLYGTLGETASAAAMTANLKQLDAPEEQRPGRDERAIDGPVSIPSPVTSKVYVVPAAGKLKASAAVISGAAVVKETVRQVGFMSADGPQTMSLEKSGWNDSVTSTFYKDRITATTVDALQWSLVETTFVAYIPHLFFVVLPIAIADTYKAMGQYTKAVASYTGVLAYPFLNAAIEGADLWQRLADTHLKWGDELFRRGQTSAAKSHYALLVTLPYAVPTASPLYAPAHFSTVRAQAQEVVKKLNGEASAAVNPKVTQAVTAAARQLKKIAAGLNILGLSDDYAPVLRFTYLQSAANYLADNAIQAERTFVQFRTQAEQSKFERMQLENAVALNDAALQVEQKRQEDADLEVTAAMQTLALTQVRRDNAIANLDDWETIGHDLASVNAALAWASNAANDQDINYNGVQYNGESHDYSGDVEDFFDTVGEVREWLNYDLQRNRLARQIAESDAEVAIANTRLDQAVVRAEVQQLNTQLAEVRLAGSQEVLEYAEDKMFNEDLWFRLAADLQDLARGYLDMAIEAAYVMERAYELEFDRDLHRIRMDYGSTGPEGLLGGDHLKQDIASFTLDYIRHAEKQNPIRVPISLREEFPQAFDEFQRTGQLPFRTDLEIFDRRYPGSYRRKLKRVELFVEGLIPVNGISGTLQHAGISTEWRQGSTGFFKHTRVVPQETMLLSSYQFRRDYAVLTPKEEVLTLFENLGPQANWTLNVWPSANDLDYQSVSDVQLVLYFDGDFEQSLADHTRTLYGTAGGRSFVRSARMHEPDEYFRIDRDRELSFHVTSAQFPQWVVDPKLTAFTVRLVGALSGDPIGARQLTITRGTETVTATTDADGTLAGDDTTMAPFDAWLHESPVDTFTVAFADGDDLAPVLDVQLALSYEFTYRADPVA